MIFPFKLLYIHLWGISHCRIMFDYRMVSQVSRCQSICLWHLQSAVSYPPCAGLPADSGSAEIGISTLGVWLQSACGVRVVYVATLFTMKLDDVGKFWMLLKGWSSKVVIFDSIYIYIYICLLLKWLCGLFRNLVIFDAPHGWGSKCFQFDWPGWGWPLRSSQ